MATIDNLSAYSDHNTLDTERLFEDVRRLLWKTCYDFVRQYGGDVDDAFGISCVKFCEICQTFDADKSSFSYWLRKKVWCHLLDHKKQEAHRLALLPRTSNAVLETHAGRQCGSFREFKAELSNDAQCVLNLLVNGQCDSVSALVDQIKNYKLPSASRRVKKAIEMELVGTWEWSRERVRSAFVEISCSLS